MMYILYNHRTLFLLMLILLSSDSIFPSGAGFIACGLREKRIQRITSLNQKDLCSKDSSKSTFFSYLYFKIPNLNDEYFNFPYNAISVRRDRSIPVLIEFDSVYLNPRKQDIKKVQHTKKS